MGDEEVYVSRPWLIQKVYESIGFTYSIFTRDARLSKTELSREFVNKIIEIRLKMSQIANILYL